MKFTEFENRKKDHIQLSLEARNEAQGESGLHGIQLRHEAFPELDFEAISLRHNFLQFKNQLPLLVSSMTAGHYDAVDLNTRLAKACAERGWLMGVGSQRRELTDPNAGAVWSKIRQAAPKVKLLGNIGLSQLIQTNVSEIQKLVDSLEAVAMVVHTNPLQECLQPEGTPHFKGGLAALANLTSQLSVPVVVKETGCGFSEKSLARLKETGVAAVDVSGYGGTHWGRIEGRRANESDVRKETAESFSQWGISTVNSLKNAQAVQANYEVWASGGVRSGLDAAKLIALGADCVGLAKPILEAALESEEALQHKMTTIEYELKTALFCTGSAAIADLQQGRVI